MKKYVREFLGLLEPKGAIWKAIVFLVIPFFFIFIGKLLFSPLDSAGAALLKSILSSFLTDATPPPGLGFAFLLGLLFLLGIWLKYEEKTGHYLLYRLHRLPHVGLLFPPPKSFQFEPCIFWVSPCDKIYGACRGEIQGLVHIAEITPPPTIFGRVHPIDRRFVVKIKMPASQLISIATTGASTLPKPEDLEPIPWPGETTEDARKRYVQYPG